MAGLSKASPIASPDANHLVTTGQWVRPQYDSAMSDLEFRRPEPGEIREFLAVSIRSYGSHDGEDRVDWDVLANEPDRSFGALEDGRWIAGSGAFSVELTLPGGATVPAAGISMIGLEPTHRRRGILTAMLRRLHTDADEHREPIAVLTASETSIYRRFGYGIAGEVAHLSIDANAVEFDPPVHDDGSFLMVDPRTAGATFAAIHDRSRRNHPGWVALSPGMWDQITKDPEFLQGGRTPLRGVVHHDREGRPDGYATWRIEGRSEPDRLAGNTLFLEHLSTADPEVEVALWAFVASIDLVKTLEWIVGPPDPAIRWRLVEPRRLRTMAVTDMTWARILDVSAVLSARAYKATGVLLLDVIDRFHPDRGGVFELTASVGGAGRCERIDVPASDADIHIDMADLSSLVVGSVTASTLHAVGRLAAADPEAVDRADALFSTRSRPWCPIDF